MRLNCEQLEGRDCPSLVSSAGVVYELNAGLDVVRSVALDPGFSGPLFVAALPGGDFLVGAGAGGGPRVSLFDGDTWAEKKSVFVGDPNSRTGVSVAAWEDAVGKAEPLSSGPADGFVVYIDTALVDDMVGQSYKKEVFAEVARILAPLDVRVTTEYPGTLKPGQYAQVRVLDTETVGWRNALGVTAERAVRNTSLFYTPTAYAGFWGSSLYRDAHVIAHEAVHLVQPDGVGHEDEPGNVMNTQVQVGANVSAYMAGKVNENIKMLKEGLRLGLHYDPNSPGHVLQDYVFGWFDIDGD